MASGTSRSYRSDTINTVTLSQGRRALLGGLSALLLTAMPSLAWAASLSVVDDGGETVTLSRPAHRVVTLAPHAAELVAAAGGLAHLVAVSQGSDYPPQVKTLPRVASYQGPNLEAVLAARPALIVAWGSGLSAEMQARLAALGLTTFLSEPRTLAQVLSNIERLGVLMGTRSEAEAYAARLEKRIRHLEARDGMEGDAPLPVFFQLGESPMTTLAGGHLVNELIRRCGGEPLLSDAPTVVPQIRREALWLAGPRLILHPVAAGVPRERWKAAWRARGGPLASVALVGLDPDPVSRPGPRSVEAMAQICHAISVQRAAR